jgi:hypothetical protein
MKRSLSLACLMVVGCAYGDIPPDPGVEAPTVPNPIHYPAEAGAKQDPYLLAPPETKLVYQPPACGWECNSQGYENTCSGALADCQTAIDMCSPVMGPCASIPVCVFYVGGATEKQLCDAVSPWMWEESAAMPVPQPCWSTPVCPAGGVCQVYLPTTGLTYTGTCQ